MKSMAVRLAIVVGCVALGWTAAKADKANEPPEFTIAIDAASAATP